MPRLDPKSNEDWNYVDTAFGLPMGGINYYYTMNEFDPDLVLDNLNEWASRYPTVRQWSQYEVLVYFFDSYYRSGFWALARNKIEKDLEWANAHYHEDPDAAFDRSENASWLCHAMLRVEKRDKEVESWQKEAQRQMRKYPARWSRSPIREL